MFTITKQFHFSASHQLTGLPADHQCARLHGHNYLVEVALRAEQLNEVGFVVDYGELTAFKMMLDERVDHRHLNDVYLFNPTAENLAVEFYQNAKTHWQQVVAVRVSETAATWAEYREQ